MTVDWIRDALRETGKTRSGLAKALGRSPSAVTDLLNGSRRLRADEIADRRRLSRRRAAAARRRRPRPAQRDRGAARRLCRRRRDRPFLRRRPGPVRRSRRRRTRRARGRSRCRSAAIRSARCSTTGWCSTTTCAIPPATISSGACACAASPTGACSIKALKRSQLAGLWTLLSNTEPPIYDVVLEWAALVREMRPR